MGGGFVNTGEGSGEVPAGDEGADQEATDPEAEVAQHVADNAIEMVARAELHGVGFDPTAHLKVVVMWESELATAKEA